MRSPSHNVVGRNTRTPLFSSCVTLDDGASSDDMTHVGTSRAVLTSCTPRLSIARRSNTRSEEHTSELQSRSDLVCRLLLEKKKKDVGHITKRVTDARTPASCNHRH